MRAVDAPDELTPSDTRRDDPTADRTCLACGYSLRGLGDEPRCPECGLLNIPSGYRKQVWELVDSGKWFFSSFFGVFAKRPPGWWWALDRPDDVRRARRFATWHLGVSLLIILAAVGIGDAIRNEVRSTRTRSYRLDPSNRTLEHSETKVVFGIGGRLIRRRWDTAFEELEHPATPPVPAWTITRQWLFESDWSGVPVACGVLVAAFLFWAIPATVGLWTQIRKGLPDFARAPRTIIAASMLEAHRVTYVAIGVAAWVGIDVFTRCCAGSGRPTLIASLVIAAGVVLVGFAVAGWIGPVRSDYTRQLVRSRWHATRIVLMYALGLPVAVTGTILATWYSFWMM